MSGGARDHLPEPLLSRVSDFIAATFGLNYPHNRWPDLKRCLISVAQDTAAESVTTYAWRLLGPSVTKDELEMLASYLTVGETYFFRDKHLFDALEQRIFPSLIAERQSGTRHLAVWSAGCATGEEPYSLAILLRRLIPDWRNWRVTILATDLNPRAIDKARAGSYSEWSFRTTPQWVKLQYFSSADSRQWTIVPEIREMVRFERVNLADDNLPNFAASMDLILCRNVLMYLTPQCTRQLISNFHKSLNVSGWLGVSSVELSGALFSEYQQVAFPGATLYRKMPLTAAVTAFPTLPIESPAAVPEPNCLPASPTIQVDDADIEDTLLRAHTCADQGKLAEALSLCQQAIAKASADARVHYLQAAILEQQNKDDEAAKSLRTTLYIEPKFVIAHFALANLARKRGQPKESLKHFENTLRVLATYQEEDILPESGGLTAGRLRELIESKNGKLIPGAGIAGHEDRKQVV